MDSLQHIDFLPCKRCITVEYGGCPLQLNVNSMSAEISLRFATVWKGVAVHQKKLRPLWCEDLLVLDPSKLLPSGFEKTVIKDDLCVAAQLAREECGQSFAEAGTASSDIVLQTLKSKRSHWMVADDDFHLEIAMIETLCGDGSERRLLAKIASLFPNETNRVSAEQVCQQMHAMTQTLAYKMASVPAQAKHSLIATVVGRLADGRAPQVNIIREDPSLASVFSAMAYFVMWTESAGNSKGGGVVFGSEALNNIFVSEKAKHDRKEATTSNVEMLRVYAFMLPSDIKEDAKSLVAALDSSSVGATLPKAKPASKKTKEDAIVAEAMAMFM